MKTFKEFLNENITRVNIIYSPEFKAWFGDWENDPNNCSKVVNKNGKPLKMYHGTNDDNEILIFNSNKGQPYNFFTNDYNEAYKYGSNINKYYINARHIFDINNCSENEIKDIKKLLNNVNLSQILSDYNLTDYTEIKNYTKSELLWYILYDTTDDWIILETQEMQEYIKSNKYDSFITHESNCLNIAIYDPCNIKKADGTNITFNKNNPNVNL